MKLLDAWRLMNALAEVEATVADLDELPIGDKADVKIPDAHKLAALLMRGKGGSRYRIKTLGLVREK